MAVLQDIVQRNAVFFNRLVAATVLDLSALKHPGKPAHLALGNVHSDPRRTLQSNILDTFLAYELNHVAYGKPVDVNMLQNALIDPTSREYYSFEFGHRSHVLLFLADLQDCLDSIHDLPARGEIQARFGMVEKEDVNGKKAQIDRRGKHLAIGVKELRNVEEQRINTLKRGGEADPREHRPYFGPLKTLIVEAYCMVPQGQNWVKDQMRKLYRVPHSDEPGDVCVAVPRLSHAAW